MARPRLRIVARIGLPRSPHSSFVLVSLAAHVMFVAILLLVPTFRPKPTFDDTYFVQLAPALPGKSSPAPAPRQQPKPPAPKPPDEGVRVAATEPKRVEPEKPKPKPEPEVEQEPAAQAATSPPVTEAEPGSEDPGGFQENGSEEGGGSIAMEGGDDALAWYRASVTASLYSYWQRPILTGNVSTLEVTVDFEIQRDGSVGKLLVTAPSGVPSLDRSALRAVADASPLPPLPAQWQEGTLPARFIFRLHPEEF